MKVVTYHRSWSYFARAFGLVVVDFVEPRPGIPPSPNHVQDLVTQMKSGDIRLLMMEPFFDPRLPHKISRDTGVPLVVLPTSVGAEDDDQDLLRSVRPPVRAARDRPSRPGASRDRAAAVPAVAVPRPCCASRRIHVYLGLHVVEREVIFVDLSLAQMAVLGAAVASLWGHEPGEPLTYAFALGFTMLGAVDVLVHPRRARRACRRRRSSASSTPWPRPRRVLILNNAPHGAEHIRDVLVGQLLAVEPKHVLRLADPLRRDRRAARRLAQAAAR